MAMNAFSSLFLPLVKNWLVAELGASIQVSFHLCPGLVTCPPPRHPGPEAREGREPGTVSKIMALVRWDESERGFSCDQKHLRQARHHCSSSQGCRGRYWPLPVHHIHLSDWQPLARGSCPYRFAAWVSSRF